MISLIELLALFVVGMLAGSELWPWVQIHPALRRLPVGVQISAEKALVRGGRFLVLLGTLVGVFVLILLAVMYYPAGDAASGNKSGGVFVFILACLAGVSMATVLGITLAGSMPLDGRTLKFAEDAPDEAAWNVLREDAERMQMFRLGMNVVAFGLVCVAVVMR